MKFKYGEEDIEVRKLNFFFSVLLMLDKHELEKMIQVEWVRKIK